VTKSDHDDAKECLAAGLRTPSILLRTNHAKTPKKKAMPDQRSLTDQLRSLIELANQNGLYDAADFLKAHLGQG
jgi:hypothetical protein